MCPYFMFHDRWTSEFYFFIGNHISILGRDLSSIAPPLKRIKDGALQVQNLNSEWTYGNSITMWSGDRIAECRRAGHPPPGQADDKEKKQKRKAKRGHF
jgi:hypothetical protein